MLQLYQVVVCSALANLIVKLWVVFVGPLFYAPPRVLHRRRRRQPILKGLHLDFAGTLNLEAIRLTSISSSD